MDIYEAQFKRNANAKRRSVLLLLLTTIVHVLSGICGVLGGSIVVGAIAKLVWRATQFGWNIW